MHFLLRTALSWRHNISLYDGLYSCRRQERSAAIVTIDGRLASATDQLGIPVANRALGPIVRGD